VKVSATFIVTVVRSYLRCNDVRAIMPRLISDPARFSSHRVEGASEFCTYQLALGLMEPVRSPPVCGTHIMIHVSNVCVRKSRTDTLALCPCHTQCMTVSSPSLPHSVTHSLVTVLLFIP